MLKKADTKPRLTLEITDKERNVAKTAKKEFKELLKQLDDALKTVFDVRDAILKERPSQDDLHNKYRGRFLRFRRTTQKMFNDLLMSLKATIESLAPISDSEMSKLREIILSDFDELSDVVETFLELLGETDREGFTQQLERICTQLEQRKKSINQIIDSRLFSHIDTDILGRRKISSIRADIYKRIRLLRKLS